MLKVIQYTVKLKCHHYRNKDNKSIAKYSHLKSI